MRQRIHRQNAVCSACRRCSECNCEHSFWPHLQIAYGGKWFSERLFSCVAVSMWAHDKIRVAAWNAAHVSSTQQNSVQFNSMKWIKYHRRQKARFDMHHASEFRVYRCLKDSKHCSALKIRLPLQALLSRNYSVHAHMDRKYSPINSIYLYVSLVISNVCQCKCNIKRWHSRGFGRCFLHTFCLFFWQTRWLDPHIFHTPRRHFAVHRMYVYIPW